MKKKNMIHALVIAMLCVPVSGVLAMQQLRMRPALNRTEAVNDSVYPVEKASGAVRIWSYNLCADTVNQRKTGAHDWNLRTRDIAALLQKYQPDIIGVQELMHHMAMSLVEQCPQYKVIGVHDAANKENVAIMYNTERFDALNRYHFPIRLIGMLLKT